ncbi:MAG: hypothetical protein JWQ21_1292 [Herminiimonas sp.]|nr:hypothetical protein [Herminiimonas sp.]
MHRLRLFFCLVAIPVSIAATATPSIAWYGNIEIANGHGEKGPWQQNNSRYDYVDDPTVAIDQYGNMAVAWVDQARKDVFVQCFSDDGSTQLAQPFNVSRSPATFSWLPRMARAPDTPERIYILWQEIIFSGGSHGGDMLFARSDDNGATFAQPLNISDSIGGDGKGRINRNVWHNGSFDLVAGSDDALYVTWTEYDGPLWFSRSTDGGKSFSRPQRIVGNGSAKPARGPSLALGKNRTLYLAWAIGDDNGGDIHFAKSVDGGATFSEPQIIAPSSSYSDAPKLAVAPDGVLHLVYAESNGGPFGKYQIRYTRSLDGGRTFETSSEISKPLPTYIESVGFPSLSIDAADRLYVVYELFPEHRQHPRGLGIAVSLDGGRSFASPSVVPGSSDPAGGTNGSHQGLLMTKLAVNRAGAMAIVNSSLEQGKHSRVWLIRGKIDPSGVRRQ